MPLQPAWQLHWASTVLEEEEPQAPGYVVHKIAVWRPTVSMTISGVCRYLQSGNWIGQFPYGQGAPPPAAATNAPPPPPAAVGEEQNTLGDQGAAGQDAGAPPADQAVVEEEVGGEVIQE